MAALHAVGAGEPAPEEFKVNLDDFTVGDLEDFEEITGVTFDDARGGGFRSIKALKALVYLMKRKTDPSFTLEDARNVKVTSLIVDAEPDPTGAAG